MSIRTFSIGTFIIKANRTEVKENNLAYKFIYAFQQQLLNIKEDLEVYNLTINGNGRYYFSPALNLIGMYFLNDFIPAVEFTSYIDEIKKNLC